MRKFPERFAVIPAYCANIIKRSNDAPSLIGLLRFLSQPGKIQRAEKFILRVEESDGFRLVYFKDHPETPLFYPVNYRWVDFCQTVDECFNSLNWHNFLSPDFKLTSSDTVVDCGAAEGLFTFVASLSGCRVHAFEPDPGFVASIKKSFEGNERVTLHDCAIGHRSGIVSMKINEIFTRICSDGQGAPTRMATLDEELGDIPISFLKADIEGHEFCMLLGAESVIRKNKPKLALTVYHETNHVPEICEFLSNCNPAYRYRTKGIHNNGHPVLLQAF